jgi:hypothetical protein
MGGRFFVVEGRFDPDKLAAAAESFGKMIGGAKKLDIGRVKAYEMHFAPGDPSPGRSTASLSWIQFGALSAQRDSFRVNNQSRVSS